MQTAMQELIEELESIKNYKYKELTIRLVKEKLEKEKEQIINFAYEILETSDEHQSGYVSIEEIYNQTYNQKIPELLYKDGTPMRKVKLGKEAQELLNEIDNEKKGDLVRLLRWVLKHYSTGTDIDGFFMWENPMGQEFDSMQVVDHYLNNKK